MISNAKRRFYLFMLAALACFLSATVLYDIVTFGMGVKLMNSASGILEFVGCIMVFLAFEALSYPDDYDRLEEFHPARHYARYFFLLALTMGLATVALIARMLLVRTGGNLGGQLVVLWGVLVIGASIVLGRQSGREVL